MSLHPILDHITEPANFARLDPLDMMGLVLKFPAQCREGIEIASRFAPEPEKPEVRLVVITGLGGSAIGADFVRALMEAYGKVPVIVNRDYTLPAYVNQHTLVIAGSYSGNTEETLAAYEQAQKAGAQIAVVTSGGKLRQLAEADGHPVALVPGGQPPRSATGYMFFPTLGYLLHRGLFTRDLTQDFEETLTVLNAINLNLRPQTPAEDNPAKQMAEALLGRLPVIYGSQGYRGAVAVRWKGQFNENTKVAAFANVLPEQNHNEILAWTQAQKQATNWSVIFLRESGEERSAPRIARRVEVTKSLLGDAVSVHEVVSQGESLLARMFSLVYFADFVTVYLAYLYGICPTDIAGIDHLKAELAKLG